MLTTPNTASVSLATPLIDPLIDNAGNSLSTGLNIGSLKHIQTASYSEWVGSTDRDDYYAFNLVGQSNLQLNLSELQSNAVLELIDSNSQIIGYSNLPTTTSETIALNGLQAGQYYIRVSQSQGDTQYILNLSTEYIRVDGTVQNRGTFPWSNLETRPVNIRAFDGAAQTVENTETWIVIHGHRSDPSGFIGELANAISQTRQVLVLDWSEPADNSFIRPDLSASWIHQVAEFTVQALSNVWGITTSNINLIGHSIGSYVASEIGSIFTGPQRQNPQVDQIIALDPARWLTDAGFDLNGLQSGFQGAADFKDVSTFSRAFWGEGLPIPYVGGEGLGSERYAHSADESFRIEFESSEDAIANHNNIVTLFTNSLNNAVSPIGRLLQLDPVQPTNWQILDGDEGLIVVNAQNQAKSLYFLTPFDTWAGAQRRAVSAGGNLVTIDSAVEQNWLLSAFEVDRSLWIGLTDSETFGAAEGSFQWVGRQPLSYTNWRSGEPNNFPHTFEGEDFVEMLPNGKWNDVVGDWLLTYGIVEIA